jgi:acetylornithine deacetylase/succinyl-diaminopimelate desuccinylase family protein
VTARASVAEFVDEDETVRLLQALLGFHTENPPGNEGPAARFLADYLRPHGFAVEYVESAPERGSLIARLPGRGGGRSLALNGHLDIGPIGSGWTRDPWGGQIEDGRIYGRGSGDMKSGLAAMVAAACAVARSGAPRRGDVVLLATADESSGGHLGMGYLARRHASRVSADMAVVCEPTEGDVCVAHRGAVWGEITVIGKSGQAARPASGVNAIAAMGRVLRALETELAPRLAARRHPRLPSPSVNAGLIDGGVKANVIAERCRVVVDRRTLPGERADDVVAELAEVATAALSGTGARVEVRALMAKDASEVPLTAPVVAECQRAFEAVTGRPPGVRASPGYTDAHWFNLELGIPAAIFGPWYLHRPAGSISDIPDEFNYVEDVLVGSRVYAQLIANVVT